MRQGITIEWGEYSQSQPYMSNELGGEGSPFVHVIRTKLRFTVNGRMGRMNNVTHFSECVESKSKMMNAVLDNLKTKQGRKRLLSL
jgi:hypothetical protein